MVPETNPKPHIAAAQKDIDLTDDYDWGMNRTFIYARIEKLP